MEKYASAGSVSDLISTIIRRISALQQLPEAWSRLCLPRPERRSQAVRQQPPCSTCLPVLKHVYPVSISRRGKATNNQVEQLQVEIRRLEQALADSRNRSRSTSVPDGVLGNGLMDEAGPSGSQAFTVGVVDDFQQQDSQAITSDGFAHQAELAPQAIASDEPLPVEPFSVGGTFLCPNGALHLHAQATFYQGLNLTSEQLTRIGHHHAVSPRSGPISKPWEAPYLPFSMTERDHQTILDLGFQALSFVLSSGYKKRFMSHMLKDPENRTATYSPSVHLAILTYGWRYCREYPIITRYTHMGQSYAERGYLFADKAKEMAEAEYSLPKICTVIGFDLLALFLAGTNRGCVEGL
jgi:hypothetical protein